MTIGGLDIGTTGCKLSVYDADGRFITEAHSEYNATRVNGEHELDAESVWDSVCTVIREVSSKAGNIGSIGVTSFGESFVMLDDNDKVLFPSMLYTDPRGSKQCSDLCRLIGDKELGEIVGLTPHQMFSLPKLMWIREHHNELYKKARRVLLMQDFTVYRLTGTAQIDYSIASRTMAFDIRRRTWSKEIFDAAQIDVSLFSAPVPSGTPAGKIGSDLALSLGLSSDVLVVSCCHDQVAAAIGAGVFHEGEAIVGTGTTECITPVFDSIPDMQILREGNYAVVPHAIADKYVSYAFCFTGGALLQWFKNQFVRLGSELSGNPDINVYQMLDEQVTSGPTGILVLPHFAGGATPYLDSGSKGAIIGLTLEHTSADIYKALMEGVSYEMLLNIEKLRQAGIRFKMLRAVGGGAKSRVWLQLKADIFGLPIVSLGASEAGTIGSIMLTGISSGAFSNLEDASAKLIHEQGTYYPDMKNHAAYMVLFEKYLSVYRAVRPLIPQ